MNPPAHTPVTPYLSVIVPFYNEEESVRALCEAVTDALKDQQYSYELILVDDGSIDLTFEVAKACAEADPRISIVKFRRNYGQTPAMAAGIDYASGAILVTMDGDLQNDPRDIPMFLEKINEGFDIVVGWRHRRQDKLITRKIPSRIANWIIGQVTGVPIKDNGCSLKAYRSAVIKEIPLYSEMHRFIPAMASIAGAKVAEVKVRHHARQFGASKYGLSRVYKVLIDLLTVKTIISFAARPLYWFSLLAAPFVIVFLSTTAFGLRQMVLTSGGYPISIVGSGFLFGALAAGLMSAGVLCEMIYKFGDLSIEKLYRLTAISDSKSQTHE